MARNRQRARERKQKLHRENVPGELETSASGVEEAEAAIVAGAGGQPYDADDEQLETEALGAGGDRGGSGSDDGFDGGSGGDGPPPLGPGAGAIGEPAPTKGRSIPRVLQFFKACWAELQRVQWPNRNQVGQGTAVVLGFVVLAGAFLGLADVIADEVVNFIL